MAREKYYLNLYPKLKLNKIRKRSGWWFTSVLRFIENMFNISLPTIAFAVLFSVFIVQIVFRYFFNHPLTWTYEVTVVAYTWVALLAAGYARKVNEHVVFSVIYDKLNAKWQALFRILGNILITVTYIILYVPAYNSITFLSYKHTSVLKIPLNIVFFPFMVFLTFVIIYSIIDIITDIKKLFRREL